MIFWTKKSITVFIVTLISKKAKFDEVNRTYNIKILYSNNNDNKIIPVKDTYNY